MGTFRQTYIDTFKLLFAYAADITGKMNKKADNPESVNHFIQSFFSTTKMHTC